MSFLLTGFLNLVFLFLIFAIPYILSGGYMHVIWQPFELMTIVGAYAFLHFVQFGLRQPVSEADWIVVRRVGKTSFLAALTIVVGGIIHTMQLLDQSEQVIGHSFAAVVAGVLLNIFIYTSFYCGPYNMSLHGLVSKVPIGNRKKFDLIVYISGLLSLTLLFIALLGAAYDSFIKEPYVFADYEKIDEVIQRVAEIERKNYDEKKCGIYPLDQSWAKRRNKVWFIISKYWDQNKIYPTGEQVMEIEKKQMDEPEEQVGHKQPR